MCRGCFDLDRRAKLLNDGVDCDGTALFKTSLQNMQKLLETEWMGSSKTHFRIDRRSVTDFDQNFIEWNATNPRTSESQRLTIEFCAA